MEKSRAIRQRLITTAVAAGGLLVAGLAVAPSALAEEATTGFSSSVKGPYTPCNVDGQTFGKGTPVGSAPLKWKYSGTPYAGARYDRCTNTVTLYYGGYKYLSYYDVKWTLSPRGTTTTYKDYAAGSRKNSLPATHVNGYTTYTVQVRACYGNLCTSWSPLVYLMYLR